MATTMPGEKLRDEKLHPETNYKKTRSRSVVEFSILLTVYIFTATATSRNFVAMDDIVLT